MEPIYFSINDVAFHCRCAVKKAWKITSQPDFPSRCYVYNGADPRWIASEVKLWLEARREAA